MKIKLPRQITKALYVYYDPRGYTEDNIRIRDFEYDDELILIAETEITIDIPEMTANTMKQKLVATLERQKEGIHAKYYMELKDVQDKIDNLLAIEYHGE